jgi:hypothetical protein
MPSTPINFILKGVGLLDPMEVKKNRDMYIKESKSLQIASNSAIEWYEDSETSKNFQIKRIRTGEELKVGKLYLFDYDPLDRNQIYDIKPLIISLGRIGAKDGSVETGINLNYFPENVKSAILDFYFRIFANRLRREVRSSSAYNVEKQNGINITWEELASMEKRLRISYGVKNYKIGRMQDISEFTYESWYQMTTYQPNRDFRNSTLAEVYRNYFEYIKNKV